MSGSSPEQGGDLARTLSRIRHGRPTWWLPADYFEKQKSDDDENGIAAEAIKTGWRAVPWYRYQSESTHYVAQQFGIGLGHELYDGLERHLSAEALSRRSKTLLATRCSLQGILSEPEIQNMTWSNLLSIVMLVHIAKEYYNRYGRKQMTELEQKARQRLMEEEHRAAEKAEAAARRELMEVPPRRVMPWEKKEIQSRRPSPSGAATPGSVTPTTLGNKRCRDNSPGGHLAEVGKVAKKVCVGFGPDLEIPSTDGQSAAQPQTAAVAGLDTQITTSQLALFLSAVLKNPERQFVTVSELLSFANNEQGSAP